MEAQETSSTSTWLDIISQMIDVHIYNRLSICLVGYDTTGAIAHQLTKRGHRVRICTSATDAAAMAATDLLDLILVMEIAESDFTEILVANPTMLSIPFWFVYPNFAVYLLTPLLSLWSVHGVKQCRQTRWVAEIEWQIIEQQLLFATCATTDYDDDLIYD